MFKTFFFFCTKIQVNLFLSFIFHELFQVQIGQFLYGPWSFVFQKTEPSTWCLLLLFSFSVICFWLRKTKKLEKPLETIWSEVKRYLSELPIKLNLYPLCYHRDKNAWSLWWPFPTLFIWNQYHVKLDRVDAMKRQSINKSNYLDDNTGRIFWCRGVSSKSVIWR